MLIATFNDTTGWSGKKITREGETFILEDYGPITAQAVMSYDQQGQLSWATDGMRAWVGSLAQSGQQPAPAQAQQPIADQSLQPSTSAPTSQGSKAGVIALVAVLAVALIVFAWACAACSSFSTESGSETEGSASDQSGAWVRVFSWPGGGSGNDIRNSDTFELQGGHQRVDVSSSAVGAEYAMPTLGWTIESADGSGGFEMINPSGFGQSQSDLYLPAGSYYLSSNTIDATWTVTVSEMR